MLPNWHCTKVFAGALALVILLSAVARSTEQIPDVCYFRDKRYYVDKFPLEDYFEQHPPGQRFDIDPKTGNELWTTSNYRGYVATWLIESDMLYLIGITSYSRIDPMTLFKKYRNRIPAYWFTGTLSITELPKSNVPSGPEGKVIGYAFDVREGKVVLKGEYVIGPKIRYQHDTPTK